VEAVLKRQVTRADRKREEPTDCRLDNVIHIALKELAAVGGLIPETEGKANPVELIDNLVYRRYVHDASNHVVFRRRFSSATGLVFRGQDVEVLDARDPDLPADPEAKRVSVSSPVFPGQEAYLCFSISEGEASLMLRNEDHLFVPPALLPRKKMRYRVLRGPWMAELAAQCRLFDDFAKGRACLTTRQLHGLVLVLGNIKGFEARFLKALHSGLYTDAERRRWQYDFDKLRQRAVKKCSPTCEAMGCPYIKECTCPGASISVLLPRRRGEIRRIEPAMPGVPLEESRERLHDVWEQVRTAENRDIHLVLVDCGVGKTHALLEHPLDRMFVAAPTHRLKNEHLKRYPYDGYLAWPEIPDLPGRFGEAMSQRHATGIGRSADIVRECLKTGDTLPADVRTACLTYLEAEEAIETAPLVFCTHEKALTTVNDVIDTVVFDEDPLNTVLRSEDVKAEDLDALASFLEHQGDTNLLEMASYVRWVLTLGKGIRRRRRTFFLDNVVKLIAREDYPRLGSPAHVLFLCQVFEKRPDGDLVCTQLRPLPSDKVVILSASANMAFYQALYGDRVRVYDLRGTALRGRIIQHPERSYSKMSLQNLTDQELVQRIEEDVRRYGLEGVIVYKRLKEANGQGAFIRGSRIPVICNFGAQYGLDAFKGRTIGIYGVPHQTDMAYKTMALAIGLPIDDYMRYGPVTRNGFEFDMWRYENPDLLSLQLAAIDAEYIQAIGRARLVDHDATVHVFSNVPAPGAILAD
jgi:hypothetical protein